MSTVTITNAGLNMLRDALNGVATNTAVTYVAIGTGSTAPAVTDTQLVAEVFRKRLTAFSNGSAAGETLLTMYLSPADSGGTVIGEIGWFAGPLASATANTGVLIARGLYSHTHVANAESIQFQLDTTI